VSDNLPERRATGSEIVFYQSEDGRSRIEVRLEDNTVWLTQRMLAELFQKDVRTVNEHVQNIYSERELAREVTIRRFRIVQTEGAREVARKVEFYMMSAPRPPIETILKLQEDAK
jgi:hypothetical protein